MTLKVGINGFGRIGRVMFRTCFDHPELEIVAINDPAIDEEYIRYLMKHDSTHGKFKGEVTCINNEIAIDGKAVTIYHYTSPENIPWHKVGVQYVVEASGMFNTKRKASGHLFNGTVKRVIVTAPSVDVPMVILGVNNDIFTIEHRIISAGSSTLYCLAPIIKVLEEKYGVKEGYVTSIHAMTPSLKPLDGLCLRGKHWRDHRGVHQNIIPATTGACRALERIIPTMKGKLAGLGFRVPIVNVSVLDMSVRLEKKTTLSDIVKSVQNKSNTSMKNVISTSKDDAVSSDFIGDVHSCILDENSSLELNPNFFKLVCWYENEYSYTCRIADLILVCEQQDLQARLTTPTQKFEALTKQEFVNKINNYVDRQYRNEESLSARSYTFSSDGEYRCSNKIVCNACKVKYNRKLPFCPASMPPSTSRLEKNIIVAKARDDENELFQSQLFKKCEYLNQRDSRNPKEVMDDIKTECKKIAKKDYLKYLTSHASTTRNEISNLNPNRGDDACNENTYIKKVINCTIECDNKSSEVIIKTENTMCDVSPKKCDVCTDITKNITSKSRRTLSNINDAKEETVLPLPLEEYDSEDMVMASESEESNNISNKHNCNDVETKSCNSVESNIIVTSEGKLSKYFGKRITTHAKKIIEFMNKAKAEQDNTPTTSKNVEYLHFQKKLQEYITQSTQSIIKSNESLQVSDITNDYKGQHPELMHREEAGQCNVSVSIGETSVLSLKSITSATQNEHDASSSQEKVHEASIKKTQEINLEVTEIPINESSRNNLGDSSSMLTTKDDCFVPIHSKKKENHDQKLDIYDKLDSGSDSENSLIDRRTSRVINFKDLTSSAEDLENLDKICKIIEISDELSDSLFSSIAKNNEIEEGCNKEWSFKDLCEKIKLEEFCNKVFHTI